MEIKELRSKKEVLRQEMQKLLDNFREETKVSIVDIEYDVIKNIDKNTILTIRNIKLDL